MRRTFTTTATALTCLVALPALAHEGGTGDEHLNVGFYYGHDGTFEAPADPADPATLLVDTHPWELDTVFYSIRPTSDAPFNGWFGDFPGFSTLAVEDEEFGGHGYYSWLNASHGVGTPNLQLHLVDKDDDLLIIDPGPLTPIGSTNNLGPNPDDHLIYYVDEASGRSVGDVLTATFYLTDLNEGFARSQDFTLQFIIAPDFVLGDLNGDGSVTNGDIAPFVQALTDADGYAEAYPALNPDSLGDFTGDGLLTNGDIAGFVNALTGGPIGTVPEPTSLALIGLSGLMTMRRRAR